MNPHPFVLRVVTFINPTPSNVDPSRSMASWWRWMKQLYAVSGIGSRPERKPSNN
jgi:hypothetical protein